MHYSPHPDMGFATIKTICGRRVPIGKISGPVTCGRCRAELAAQIERNAAVIVAARGLPGEAAIVQAVNDQSAAFRRILASA